MSLPRISLQALDAFERVARTGSVQIAAAEMELSISSVSHHIARLEDQMGVVLFDRSTRPFVLTREGHQALQHLSKGLLHIKRATSESAISGLLSARSLRIGVVEEFESTVTPELARFLTKQMPKTTLSISNVLSHQANDLLKKGDIDLAIVSQTDSVSSDLNSIALMREPYVAALPAGLDLDPADLLQAQGDLSFLRFNQSHLIGKHIETHLARNNVELANRFVFDSVQSILSIVASGTGWSIITPLGFMRAQRFAASIGLHVLPLPAFSRKIVLATRDDFDDPTRLAIATLLRQIMNREVIEPAIQAYPWLSERLLIEE